MHSHSDWAIVDCNSLNTFVFSKWRYFSIDKMTCFLDIDWKKASIHWLFIFDGLSVLINSNAFLLSASVELSKALHETNLIFQHWRYQPHVWILQDQNTWMYNCAGLDVCILGLHYLTGWCNMYHNAHQQLSNKPSNLEIEGVKRSESVRNSL